MLTVNIPSSRTTYRDGLRLLRTVGSEDASVLLGYDVTIISHISQLATEIERA